MRVSTLLRKERDGTLFHKHGEHDEGGKKEDAETQRWHAKLMERHAAHVDRIPGGLADHKQPSDFPPGKLRQGMKVESEHTSDPRIAREIAMDHLVESRNYYADLAKMEEHEKKGYELQGHTEFQGLPIAIENAVGSVRKGTDADGTPWKTKYKVPYGYIKGTKGADGEEVDCYVGKLKTAPTAYVVRQKKDDGSYDEDTVMLGFGSKKDAKEAILDHYDDPKYVGSVVPVTMERLQTLVDAKKKLVKIGGLNREYDNDFTYGDNDIGRTGIPARLPRKKLETPPRDEVELNPTPKVEARQDYVATPTVGAFADPGGYQDLGKTAMNKISHGMEALGQMSRSWEVPSDESPTPYKQRAVEGVGGSVQALAPERTAADQEVRGPRQFSLSEIGTDLDGSGAIKGAAPEKGRTQDNQADIQDLGSTALEEPAPGGAVPSSYSLKTAFREGLLEGLRSALTPEQFAKVAEVSHDQAAEALKRLDLIETSRPTAGQLARGAAIGAIVGPLASNAQRLITHGGLHTPREIGGQIVGGLVTGTAMPFVKNRLESRAERQTLRNYVDAGGKARLVQQIQDRLDGT